MIYLFRGDSRPPSVIFKEGFMPKEPSSPTTELGMQLPFESSPDSVSFSADLAPAGLFPIGPSQEAPSESWFALYRVLSFSPEKPFYYF